MAEKEYVSWDMVENFSIEVAKRYEFAGITGVYGIPRGGISIAQRLSYLLDVPFLLAPCKGCLIIDDIADTGESLIHYARNTSGGGEDKGYHIVTMFYRKGSFVIPEFYKYIKEEKWIVFPWEKTLKESTE